MATLSPVQMELLHPNEGLGSTSVSRETKLQSSDPNNVLSLDFMTLANTWQLDTPLKKWDIQAPN